MKSAMFTKIMQFVFEQEGQYSNDPADPGGVTNYGITQRTLDAWLLEKKLPPMDVKDMSKITALDIYEAKYWKQDWEVLGFPLAACMLDTSINMGMSRASKFLRDCNSNYVNYLQLRLAKYNELISINSTLKKFIKGWMNRLTALRRFIDENREVSI